MLLCAIVTALIWVAAVAALLFVAFTMDYRGPAAPSETTGISIAVGGWLALFAAMVYFSARWRRPPARPHYLAGMWIGFGIACLIEGICFVGMN